MTLCTVTSSQHSRLHTYGDTCTLCSFFSPPAPRSVCHVAIPPSGDQTKWGFSGGMIYLLNGRIRIWEPPFFTGRWHHLPKSRKKTAAHPDSKHSSFLCLHPDLLYNLFFYTKLFVINTCILWVRIYKPGRGHKTKNTKKTKNEFFVLLQVLTFFSSWWTDWCEIPKTITASHTVLPFYSSHTCMLIISCCCLRSSIGISLALISQAPPCSHILASCFCL